MRGKKRSPRVVWLPPTDRNSLDPGNLNGLQNFIIDFVGTNETTIGASVNAEIPLVIDGEDDDPIGAVTLSDIENSSYRLRRIVGKIFVFSRPQAQQGGTAFGAPLHVVTGGLIVRKIDVASGDSLALQVNQVSPTAIRNWADPWIWRRSWMVRNVTGVTGGVTTLDLDSLSGSNFGGAAAGGIADGPHIDQKTARLVGNEERLFLSFTASVVVPRELGGNDGTQIQVLTDLRVLGSMRTGMGNRRNATR